MQIDKLQFFDQSGYNLNFELNDSGYWEGSIYLPKVSVGLYANTTIYVLEEVDNVTINDLIPNDIYLYKSIKGDVQKNPNTDPKKLYYSDNNGNFILVNNLPVEVKPNSPVPENAIRETIDTSMFSNQFVFPVGNSDNDIITFKWDPINKFVDEFFMFNFDENYAIKETSALIYTPNDGPDCNTLIVNRFDEFEVKLNQNYNSKALPIHVAFMANEKYDATTYNRTLYMYYNNQIVASIKFYAETVEEDERLKIWNDNLGYNITPEDEMIFYKSDIKEYKPDYILLNEKRKELMMEGSNIYPYIGSYKAIINAIKFFGYENLNIIEFWRNVNPDDENFGKIYNSSKYSLTHKETLTIGSRNIVLPNKDYKKVNALALVYSINEPTGEVDKWELPLVRETFTYTLEEALIKLFALKKKLNKEFMPGSSKIIDIIGEANYFGIQGLRKIYDSSHIEESEDRKILDFDVYPSKYIHITDNTYFARYINLTDEDTPIQNQMLSDIQSTLLNDININQLSSNVLDELYHMNNKSKCEKYKEYYQAEFVDHSIYKSIRDNDAYSYENDEYDYPVDNITDSDVDVGYFLMRFAAKAVLRNTSFKNITFGDCELNFNCENTPLLHNGDNWSFGEKQYISATFGNINDVHLPNKISWTVRMSTNQYDDDLKKIGITKQFEYKPFEFTRLNRDRTEFDECFVTLPYAGYYDVTMELYTDDTLYATKTMTKCIKVEPYQIDLRGFYYDMRDLPKDMQYEDDETMTNFIKETVSKMYEWAAAERNNETDPDASVPTNNRPGPYYTDNIENEWYLADNLSSAISLLDPLAQEDDIYSSDYDGLIKYTRYIKSGVDVKPYTWFLLGYEFSKITGKKNPHWYIINNTTGDQKDFIGKKYLILLLKKEGNYTVRLELEDWLGNKYEISRNIIVVSKSANYNIYQSFKNDYDFMTEQSMLSELNEYYFSDKEDFNE